ncbi:MAG: hypothetical protein ACAI25_15730 [Planctomycetota bacterium]
MDLETRVNDLVAPLIERFAGTVDAALRPDLESGLRGEARALVGALEQGLTEKDLRDLIARQLELEVLSAPPELRGDVLRAWAGSRALLAALEPLGLRARELVRELRASGLDDALKAEASRVLDEVVRVARAAPPEVLARERGTVAIVLGNCALVLSDGLLGPDLDVEVG